MKLHSLSSTSHERVSDCFVCNREIELVRLDHSRIAAFTFAETSLDSPSFICLEYISLLHDKVQFSSLYTFSEYEIELEENECCQC